MSNNLDFTKSSSHFSGYTRVVLAFLIALMLIVFSTDIAFLTLLYLKKFYVSLFFGIVTALFILEMLHWVNVILDRVCSWQRQFLFRLFMQIVFGVFFLLYLDIALVKGFYMLFDNDFEHSGFMERIFSINIVLVCTGHIIFFLRQYYNHLFNLNTWYLKFKRKNKFSKPELFLVLDKNGKPLVEKQVEKHSTIELSRPDTWKTSLLMEKKKLMGLSVLLPEPKQTQYWGMIDGYIQTKKYTFLISEVICICTGGTYGDIFLKNGNSYNMHYRRKILRKYLDPEKFIEVYAGVFYAYDGIMGYETEGGNKVLLLKEGIKIDSKKAISRRHFEAFVIGFASYREREKRKLSKPTNQFDE